ncbi:DUF6603 domain-containing protein [Streptomyces sp. CA2R101]|uniref:DUF6603 domain-containing protein n=1 Tax=Streptomyces sp. CA2R101 TaxID=3120152 RepID=UPI00300962B8
MRVDLDTSWEIFPGWFEISELRAEFAVLPKRGGRTVSAQFGGLLTLAEDIKLSAAVRVPELGVVAELVEEAPLAPLLELFLPASGLPAGDLSVHRLRFEAAGGQSGPAYGLDMGIDGTWQITDGIALSGLELSVLVDGQRREGLLAANWLLGSGSLRISAERREASWRFAGTAYGITAADLFGVFGTDPPQILGDLELASLHATFDSPLKNVGLSTTLAFPLGDADCTLTLTASLTRQAGAAGFEKDFSGVLRLTLPGTDESDALALRDHLLGTTQPGPRVLEFAVTYDEFASGATVTGSWSARPGVPLTDLASALGVQLPGLPEVLQPELESLGIRYDTTTKRVILTAATEHTGWVFVTEPGTSPGAARVNAAAVRVDLDARASGLPLVGEAIPAGQDLVLDGLAFTSAPDGWTAQRAQTINAALDALDAGRALPRFAADVASAAPGLAVLVELVISGARQQPLVLALTGTGGKPVVTASRLPERPPPVGGEAANRELELVCGPVRFRRLRLGFTEGLIFVALDAVLTVGPVELILLGLGLGLDGELNVSPVLRGAGVVLNKPPLRISGMVERRTGSEIAPGLKEQFVGLASVETGFFALQAAGSYAKAVDGWSSLFLFGEVSGGERGLFGPPPFRVIGISLGFGVNSTVRTPTIAQVGQFPLVNRLDGSSSGESPEQVLAKLAGPGGWITPREGQYWGAGGIEFSSFEFIRSRALLLVEGGESWKVLLIGRTTIDLPRNLGADKPPIARIVIDVAIGYHHDQGLFAMDAVIAPGSYVIDPAAELTGGLSLYIWGKDRTAQGGGKGFVFTLGGYHPRFAQRLPSYYPRPPRVGWRWQRGPVTIRGQVYAALTDGAFMAGGELSAGYDQGHGIQLQAWFTAWLDALVQWKPFYFDLSMGLNIGVAATVKVWFVRVRISLEVGVSLDLWGPPIGGRAKVKVWFITFTINFGNDRDRVPVIEWPEFKVQLPAPLSITPLRGLLVDVDPEESAARSAAGEPVLISADGFAVRTEAAVPASSILYNGAPLPGGEGGPISIRPMGLEEAVSEHRVSLKSDTGASVAGWKVESYRQDMPKAMWGAPLADPADALDGDGLLSNCLAGITFEIPQPELALPVGWVDADALEADRRPDAPIPLLGSEPEGPASVVDEESIAAIVDAGTGIAAGATAARRSSVHAALAGLGLAPGTDDPLTRYEALAQTTFTSPPMTTAAER